MVYNMPSNKKLMGYPFNFIERESNMNKKELIVRLHEETKITKSKAAKIVDIFFNEMSEALLKGDRVELRGLFTFFVKKYKSWTFRNPKTGKKVKIVPKKLPFFRCGKELKERVNY